MTRADLINRSCCIVVPTYNNGPVLASVLHELKPFGDQVIVVNDGSTDNSSSVLNNCSEFDVVAHPVNKGKGKALLTGFKRAAERNFHYALTIDSDGQHRTADIGAFLSLMDKYPGALLIGSRNLEADNMPGKNTFANRFSNFWFHLETGHKLPDTQSGFRLYPLAVVHDMRTFTSRYEFELEVLVRSAWKGVRLVPVPISVYYPPAGHRISHFRPFRDFFRISVLNAFLVLAALLWYRPVILLKRMSWRNIKKFLKDKVVRTEESNGKKATAIGFGVFMGIFPVWGYQMILAAVLAHFFRLNKAIVLIASNISIGPMIPVVIYLSYQFGGAFMDHPADVVFDPGKLSLDHIGDRLMQYLVGSVLLSVASGITIGLISYLSLLFFRKKVTTSE